MQGGINPYIKYEQIILSLFRRIFKSQTWKTGIKWTGLAALTAGIALTPKTALADNVDKTYNLPKDPKVTSQQLTEDGIHTWPVIEENYVVWQGKDSEKDDWDIFTYNRDTKEIKRLKLDGDQKNPDITGDKLVWQDDRNGNWDIYFKNPETGKSRQITSNPKDQKYCEISGNKIVFADWRDEGENGEIYLYNLKTEELKQITNNEEIKIGGASTGKPAKQVWPFIDNNWVTWTDNRTGFGSDIFAKNLETGEEIQVSDTPRETGGSRIENNLITFYNNRDHSDTFIYDLEEREKKLLGKESYDEGPTDIFSDIIGVYRKSDNDCDVVLYDLSEDREITVANSDQWESWPDVHENSVAFVKFSPDYETSDIYLAELQEG